MAFMDSVKDRLLRGNKNKNPVMMRRARIACVVVLLALVYAAYSANITAYLGNLGQKDYYGEHYSELLHIASVSDKQFALPAAKLFEQAVDFEGTQAEAEEKFGVLARYCGYYDWKMRLVTASAEDGCLWFTYTNNSSKNVLVRIGIAADGSVTDVLEAP